MPASRLQCSSDVGTASTMPRFNDRFVSVRDDLPTLLPPDRGSIKPFWQTKNFSGMNKSDMSIYFVGFFPGPTNE